MTLKRLAIGHADDIWGNQTYETETGLVDGKLCVESRPIGDGVDIADTEVVLLGFLDSDTAFNIHV